VKARSAKSFFGSHAVVHAQFGAAQSRHREVVVVCGELPRTMKMETMNIASMPGTDIIYKKDRRLKPLLEVLLLLLFVFIPSDNSFWCSAVLDEEDDEDDDNDRKIALSSGIACSMIMVLVLPHIP
jgi:hypothetical protein